MKNKIALTVMALGLAFPAVNSNAQDDSRPPRGPRAGIPLVAALDLNHDRVLNESELNAAAESLRTLDKNSDGQLTVAELRPERPTPRANGEQPDGPRPPRQKPAKTEGTTPAASERPAGPPLIAALDANADRVIDATEIAHATAALKTLDKNSDGQLTMAEINPRRPGARKGERPAGAKRRSPAVETEE